MSLVAWNALTLLSFERIDLRHPPLRPHRQCLEQHHDHLDSHPCLKMELEVKKEAMMTVNCDDSGLDAVRGTKLELESQIFGVLSLGEFD